MPSLGEIEQRKSEEAVFTSHTEISDDGLKSSF
jgi:hypothetical protein